MLKTLQSSHLKLELVGLLFTVHTDQVCYRFVWTVVLVWAIAVIEEVELEEVEMEEVEMEVIVVDQGCLPQVKQALRPRL